MLRLSPPTTCCALLLPLLAGATAAPSDSVVVFNELMYHPPAGSAAGEWVELYNQMGVDVDISGWRLSGGIDFTFPDGTVVAGGGFLVVAALPAQVPNSLGPFIGLLDNGGETVNLRDNSDRLMDSVRYGDDWPWPPAADGGGASLTKSSPLLPTGTRDSWRASLTAGGTPGTGEVFPPDTNLHFSEVAAAGDPSFFVELHNPGDTGIPLQGIQIVSSSGTENYTLPAGTLAAGGHLSISSATLGFAPLAGQRLFLLNPAGTQIWDGVRLTIDLQGRRGSDTNLDPMLTPDLATPGGANTFTFEDAVVINEIMYHARPTFASEGVPPTYTDVTVLPIDTTWRYHESGVSPGTGWQGVSFDDSAWPSGQALLGFEDASLPEPLRTGLTRGSVTFYFRTSFNYTGNPATDLLRLRLVLDDGAVIYINGAEVLRPGMPGGTIGHSTLASTGVTDADYQTYDLPTNSLVPGQNLIAVEVHQSSPGSSDLVFGMEVVSQTQTDPGIPETVFTESREEWVELFNRSASPVDLGGWSLGGGIGFTFPAGTTLAGGGYLVVADDLAAFAAAHPGVAATGEYSGGLGNSSDEIVLLDARGNPADHVRYFDGGRWDSGADGYGPSLELIDPSADNSRGEAWRASDEAAKSTWRTYSYRALADSPVPGDPTLWQEFALGLLHGEGEILIDDVSVVQDPDGAATQRIQNGTFAGGSSASWRLLGNHQRSFVENGALRLVASGACEYQGNQIETTFGGGASVVNGADYEISFRARWLSGSSHLNTRLYFNRAAGTIEIDVPGSNGTPGAANSRLVANTGPTFGSLTHSPLLPNGGQAVTITASPSDPQGVTSATLHYRTDSGTWATAAMAVGGDGSYSATVPGQGAGTVVQFYVSATDGLGATTTMPAAGPASRALFEVNDGVTGGGAVHDLRAIMLTADSDHLHLSTNSLSNELLGATVLYQGEAFYDAGIRLKGSFVGRDAARVGFNIKFNPDQLFRGIHDKVAVDRSTHGNLGVDEILIKHVAVRAGDIPGMYDDLVQFIAPRSAHNRRALLRIAGFDDIYLDSQFENGSDGTVYEYEVYRWATTTVDGNPESLKRAGGLHHPNGFLNIPFGDLGEEKEDYRWHCLITSNRRRDDYGAVVPFLQAFSSSGSALEAAAPGVMDVDSVLRTLAYQTLVGPGDCTYTGGADHNFRLYARPDGKVMYLPWDWDSAFQRSTGAPLVGGGRLANLVNRPAHLRIYHGHLKDIIEKAFNTTYMSTWTSHYGALGGQNFSGRLSYIGARASFVLGQLPAAIPFTITSNGGNDFSVSTPTATLVGDGWIDVAEIRTSATGAPLAVTWTDSDSWSLTLPLSIGANPITLLAFDRDGNQVGGDLITVTNTGPAEAATASTLAISEIMYHPASGGVEFVELMNIGANRIDLTGVRFGDGIDFSFAAATALDPGGRLVLTENTAAFAAVYGTGIGVAGEFQNATRLSNAGERILLLAGDGSTIRDFTYDDRLPWPTAPDGGGPSLVLIDPGANPDHSLPASWRSSAAPGGNPGASDATAFSGTAGADIDTNGVDDLLDYALGHGPGDTGGLPAVSFAGALLSVSYTQNLAADDASLAASWSTDLVTWSPLGDSFDLAALDPAGPGRQTVTFVSDPSRFVPGPRFFVRLEVQR